MSAKFPGEGEGAEGMTIWPTVYMLKWIKFFVTPLQYNFTSSTRIRCKFKTAMCVSQNSIVLSFFVFFLFLTLAFNTRNKGFVRQSYIYEGEDLGTLMKSTYLNTNMKAI